MAAPSPFLPHPNKPTPGGGWGSFTSSHRKSGCKATMVSSIYLTLLPGETSKTFADLHPFSHRSTGPPLSPQCGCSASFPATVAQPHSCHTCRCHGDTFLPAMPGGMGTQEKAFPSPLPVRSPRMCPWANPASQVERCICAPIG